MKKYKGSWKRIFAVTAILCLVFVFAFATKSFAIDIDIDAFVPNTAAGGGGGPKEVAVPLQIYNVRITQIGPNQFEVRWSTNKPATSFIRIGETTEFGMPTKQDGLLVTEHVMVYDGLKPGTEYFFQVQSTDATSSTVTSPTLIVKTPDENDLVPPLIIGPYVTDITTTTAKVGWHTNEATRAYVDYGLTTGYEIGTVEVPNFDVDHLTQLIGLTPDTLYHARIRAFDASGNLVVSEDLPFRTLPLDVNPPPGNVMNLTSSCDGNGILKLSWQYPPEPDIAGVVIVRKESGYPANRTDGEKMYEGNATTFTAPMQAAGARYFYTVFTLDTAGNVSTGALLVGMCPEGVPVQILAKPEKRWPRQGNWWTTALFTVRDPGQLNARDMVQVPISKQGTGSTQLIVPVGTYDFSIKGLSHLRKVLRNVSLPPGGGTADFTYGDTFALLAGDTHESDDNLVNSLDLSTLLMMLNTGNIKSDLNADGQVNSLDINILITNLSVWGEE